MSGELKVLTQQSMLHEGNLVVKVRAEDVAGPQDHGGVHIWDTRGNSVDVGLRHDGMVSNRVGPTDEMWAGKIPLGELRSRGLDVNNLVGATGFVDIDKPNGQAFRVWERRDHQIRKLPKDDMIAIRENPGPGDKYDTAAIDTSSGRLTAKRFFDLDVNAYRSQRNVNALKELSFTDQHNYFGGAEKLQVVVVPRSRHRDRGTGSTAVRVERDMRNLNRMNRITLERQNDGSYRASAPLGKALVVSPDTWAYMGDSEKTTGFEIAIVDPSTNRWDSRDGRNYLLKFD